MKALKWVAVISILATSALAQTPGFFVSAGGGMAKMKVDGFAVYNPVASVPGQPQGEALAAIEKNDTVSVVRLTVGYNLTENWGLQLSYANYGSGEVRMEYPGIFWAQVIGISHDVYLRHVLKYQTSAFTFIPSYTFRLNEKLGIKAGAGVSYNKTSSHFEATYIPEVTIFPITTPQSYSYAKKTEQSLGYIVSLGADYLITKKLSLELSSTYTAFKMKVPTSPWATNSKSSVKAGSLSAELALAWHF